MKLDNNSSRAEERLSVGSHSVTFKLKVIETLSEALVVGSMVGRGVGCLDGSGVGAGVGLADGTYVGTGVGTGVGFRVGTGVGTGVGA